MQPGLPQMKPALPHPTHNFFFFFNSLSLLHTRGCYAFVLTSEEYQTISKMTVFQPAKRDALPDH